MLVLEFGHNGLLPASAEVKIYVGYLDGIEPGDQVFIYYINETTGKLDSLPVSTLMVDENGYITLNVTHSSQYLILKEEPKKDIITSLPDQIKVIQKKTLYIGGTTGNTFILAPELPATIKQVNEFGRNADRAVAEAVITYRTDDKSIAKVSKTGKVTAAGAGKTNIITTITFADGTVKKFTTAITVKKASISFAEAKEVLKVGEKATYKVSVNGYSTKGIIWQTDKKGITVVAKNEGKKEAVVTAKNKGTEHIIVKVPDSNGKYITVKTKVVVK